MKKFFAVLLLCVYLGRPQSGPDPGGGPVLRNAAGEGRLHRLRAQELRGGLPGITRFPAKTKRQEFSKIDIKNERYQ